MPTGAQLISSERFRQIEIEGWTDEHDDAHDNCELSSAACCYADPGANGPYSYNTPGQPPPGWPWGPEFWKPKEDPVLNLIRAGALIAAEIDRMLRQRELHK